MKSQVSQGRETQMWPPSKELFVWQVLAHDEPFVSLRIGNVPAPNCGAMTQPRSWPLGVWADYFQVGMACKLDADLQIMHFATEILARPQLKVVVLDSEF